MFFHCSVFVHWVNKSVSSAELYETPHLPNIKTCERRDKGKKRRVKAAQPVKVANHHMPKQYLNWIQIYLHLEVFFYCLCSKAPTFSYILLFVSLPPLSCSPTLSFCFTCLNLCLSYADWSVCCNTIGAKLRSCVDLQHNKPTQSNQCVCVCVRKIRVCNHQVSQELTRLLQLIDLLRVIRDNTYQLAKTPGWETQRAVLLQSVGVHYVINTN